jgi:hypothetical protein
MEFDFGQVAVAPGSVTSYPDHIFVDQPLPARDIKDSASIVGDAAVRGGITGSASPSGQIN